MSEHIRVTYQGETLSSVWVDETAAESLAWLRDHKHYIEAMLIHAKQTEPIDEYHCFAKGFPANKKAQPV